MHRALDPFIQVLKPISPLAWMPPRCTQSRTRRSRRVRDLHLLAVADADNTAQRLWRR